MRVPLLDLKPQYQSIKKEIMAEIERVCDAQHFILSSDVEEFEYEIAQYTGSEFAIGVASGSDALLLSLMAIGVNSGDEVITTPYSFFATGSAITRLGARPVFVDIDKQTYNINPDLIKDKISRKTKAIIPVHLYGQSADMDRIMDLAKSNDIKVIEDAAQAIGAEYKKKRVGSIGDLGCLSFFPSKNLGGFGDGGMVTTNDKTLADKIKILRVHGSEKRYHHDLVGINSRLDSIQAAALKVKLRYLEKWNEARRNNAERYNKMFMGDGLLKNKIDLPYSEDHNRHIYNQYVIRVKDRDKLASFLKENEIGTEVYYPIPLHLQKCFEYLGYKKGDFPESETAAGETLALPIYPELTPEMQEYVVEKIKEFY